MSSNNFQMGHCEDCLMYKCEVASLKGRIEQLEKEKAKLYDRCLENEEAIPDVNILDFSRAIEKAVLSNALQSLTTLEGRNVRRSYK